jgi:glycosyltransferase involved in cell wall biosynthesis
MSQEYHKVLVIATSCLTKGGITSVIKAHQTGGQWEKFHCKWLETHIDKGSIFKLYYFLKAVIQYLFLLPAYDLVHIHTSEPSSALRKVFFLWYAKLFGKKVIVHFHAFSIETTINSKFRQVYRFLFSKADVVIVLSEYWRTEIIQTFKLSHKIKILYNPCTSPDNTILYEKQKSILYAGAINDRKGYKDLITAFAKIAKEFPDWKLVFAGSGEIEQAKNLSRELNIESQCLFLGWISGDLKDKTFKEASLFCLPSYAEGFPMAVLDAFTYGIPVVTTPVGGIPDFAISEENMLLFQPGDVEKLAGQLEKIILDKELYKKLCYSSVNFAKEDFSISKITKELGDIYKFQLS